MQELPRGFRVVSQPEQEREQEALPEGFEVVERGWGDAPSEEAGREALTAAQLRTREFRDEGEATRRFVDQENRIPDLGINSRNLLQAFNLGDEAAGLNARLHNIGRPEAEQLDPEYAAQLERERVDRMREETPLRAGVAEFMGAAPLATVRMGQGAVQAFTQARPYVSAALAGAAGGSAVGAGDGETTQERGRNAAIYGTIGAIAGPATMRALGFIGNQATRLGRATGLLAQPAEEAGGEVVEEAARMARRMGVADDIDRAHAQGLEGEAGDFAAERLGANSRQTAVGLSGMGDAAQDIAEDALQQRAAGRAGRVDALAANATGRGAARSATDDLLDLDAVRASAKPLFDAADDTQGRISGNARRILRNIQRSGISLERVNQISARYGERGINLSAYGDDIGELPDVVRLGDLRATARAVEAEARRLQRAGDDPGNLWNMARELRDSIGRQSPEYRDAARIWRGAARDEEALEIGQDIFRAGAQEEARLTRYITGGMSQSERRMFFAGVTDAIQKRLDNVATGGNTAARLDRRIIERRLRLALGDEAAEEMMAGIRREVRQARFEAQALREIGSQTEPRQAGRARVQRGQAGPARRAAAEGVENPVGLLTAREGRRQIAEVIRSGSDEALGELARALYSQGDVSSDPLVRRVLAEARKRGVGVLAANPVGGVAAGANAIGNRLE